MKQIGNVFIITFSVPPVFLVEVDKWAKKNSRGRSEFLREASRRYIAYLKREEKKNESKI